MIDGFNLGLKLGTGISTYSRNLSYAFDQLGVSVDVLYGAKAYQGPDQPLREIQFFDDREGGQSSWRRSAGMTWRTLLSPLARTSSEIEVSGRVEIRPFADRLPLYDRLFTASRLFSDAQLYFQTTGSLLPVRAPDGVDVMHWTSLMPVRAMNVPNVYTVHDLIPLRLPYTTLDSKQHYYRMAKKALGRADGIVTVSQASLADIHDFFPEVTGKVVNTYQSARIPDALIAIPQREVDAEVESLIPVTAGRYFIYFGSIEPKKNIGRMVEAFLAANTDHKLVIVGAQNWKSEQDLKLLNSANFMRWRNEGGSVSDDRRIIVLDYLSFPRLVSLIRGAAAVLFPSLYEGFGLPVLEGLCCGVRVITSRLSSLPEVGGEVADYVDPYDVRDIKRAIERVSREGRAGGAFALAARTQASRFSVDRHAERLEGAYRRFGVKIDRRLKIRTDLISAAA